MAFHELTTNALKFGALSTFEGEVQIAWHVDGDVLQLTWTETGGPPSCPSRQEWLWEHAHNAGLWKEKLKGR